MDCLPRPALTFSSHPGAGEASYLDRHTCHLLQDGIPANGWSFKWAVNHMRDQGARCVCVGPGGTQQLDRGLDSI